MTEDLGEEDRAFSRDLLNRAARGLNGGNRIRRGKGVF